MYSINWGPSRELSAHLDKERAYRPEMNTLNALILDAVIGNLPQQVLT